MDEGKLKLISQALDNKFLSSFDSNRYALYDISFRESGTRDNIGLSFNDVKDSIYMNPNQIFKSFLNFGIDSFIDTINKIQNCIFKQRPQYNPVFMIGLVIDDVNLTCIKGYIRYDLAKAPTSIERRYIVENMVKVINPRISSVEYFSNFVQNLENLGFVFSFVGVDGYSNAAERFKIYFRFRLKIILIIY